MKKFTKSLIAFIAAASVFTSFAAGCKKENTECVHEVSEWETDKAATCVATGIKHGLCVKCYEVVEEVIPIDSEAHDVEGVEWTITTYPTEEETGLATKICNLDSSHVIEVTLPVVTAQGTGYDSSERTVVPSAVSEGKQTLTLKNEKYGDIEFEVTLPRRELTNLEAAVTVAASLGSLIRTSTGTRQDTKESSSQAFSVYFGNDYTHITDNTDNMEYWYSHDDDGNPFGVYSSIGGSSVTTISNVTEDALLGYNWVTPAKNSNYFYGAEMILEKIYDIVAEGTADGNSTVACWSEKNNEFTKNRDGSVSASFSFSNYENPNFIRYTVEFTTFSSGALKTLDVTMELIRGYMIAEDAKGNKLFYKDDGVYVNETTKQTHTYYKNDVIFAPAYAIDDDGAEKYEYDERGNLVYETDENGNDVYLTDAYGMQLTDADGNPIKRIKGTLQVQKDENGNTVKDKNGAPITIEYYSDDHEGVNYRTIHFVQTEKSDDDVVEENPYPADSAYVKSFTVTSADIYGGDSVAVTEEDGQLKVSLPANVRVDLMLGGVQEPASFEYDPIAHIYAVDPTGKKIELNANTINSTPYPILAIYQAAKEEDDDNDTAHGERVMINSKYTGTVEILLVTKSGKGQRSIEITFTKTAPTAIAAQAEIYDDSDGTENYVSTYVGGSTGREVTVYAGQSLEFTAVVASEVESTYADVSFTPSCTDSAVSFTLKSADDCIYSLTASTAGTYTITLTSTLNSSVTTSFVLNVKEKPDVLAMLSGNTFTGTVQIGESGVALTESAITAKFNADGTIDVTIGGSTAVYTYSVSDSGVLTAVYKSGVSGSGYDFTFKINEAYSLTVTHGLGFGEETETVVLHLA